MVKKIVWLFSEKMSQKFMNFKKITTNNLKIYVIIELLLHIKFEYDQKSIHTIRTFQLGLEVYLLKRWKEHMK